MMPKVKKTAIIIFICIIALVFSSGKTSDGPGPDAGNWKLADTQTKYMGMYSKLTSGMDETLKEYYGGSYIGGDELVVLLTDLKRKNLNRVMELTGPMDLRFEECRYTHAHLLNITDGIGKAMRSLFEEGLLVDEAYVDTVNNQVVVSIRNIDENKIDRFREFADDPCITFMNSEKGPLD